MLDSIRRILTIKTHMVQFKNKNLCGQREGTRSRAVIDRVHGRACAAADKYCTARKAKLSLAGPGNWEAALQVLNDSDIHLYQDPNHLQPCQRRGGILEDDQLMSLQEQQTQDENDQSDFVLFNQERSRRDGTGETRRTISWIWLNRSLGVDASDDVLRSGWAKSRARAARGREEVMLLKEEMQRTLESLAWEADDWKKRAVKRSEQVVLEDGLKERLYAYAMHQNDIQTNLAIHFRSLWEAPLSDVTRKNGSTNMRMATTASNGGAPDDDDVEEDEGFDPDKGNHGTSNYVDNE